MNNGALSGSWGKWVDAVQWQLWIVLQERYYGNILCEYKNKYLGVSTMFSCRYLYYLLQKQNNEYPWPFDWRCCPAPSHRTCDITWHETEMDNMTLHYYEHIIVKPRYKRNFSDIPAFWSKKPWWIKSTKSQQYLVVLYKRINIQKNLVVP